MNIRMNFLILLNEKSIDLYYYIKNFVSFRRNEGFHMISEKDSSRSILFETIQRCCNFIPLYIHTIRTHIHRKQYLQGFYFHGGFTRKKCYETRIFHENFHDEFAVIAKTFTFTVHSDKNRETPH